MAYSEINFGPRESSSGLHKWQPDQHHKPRVDIKHLEGVEDLYRKIMSPAMQDIFTQGINRLMEGARKGEDPSKSADQLAQLFGLISKKTARLTQEEYTAALESLREVLKQASEKKETIQ